MAGEDDVRDDAGVAPPAPAGPAPVVELGEDAVPVRPPRPLGPRRLARIQRELAERERELEELAAGPAGPELLEKQRRFAELAAQAEAANAGAATASRGSTAAGTAGTEHSAPSDAPGEDAPAGPTRGPVLVEPGPAEPLERITVVFPDSGAADAADGHGSHDLVHVDPALFSNRLAPEELAALTHIEILAPGEPGRHVTPEHHGEPEQPMAAEHHVAAEHPGEPDHHVAADHPVAAQDPGLRGSHSATAAAPPDEVPAPPPGAVPDGDPVPPAAPVPATRAGGLELLEPGEYRSRGENRWWTLLLGVLLAVLVLVVLTIL